MINRKFRFRVWDIDNKCWYRSTQLVIRPYTGRVTDGATTPNVVLSQWTGLKDKNNMLIYEGDIVKCQELNERGLQEYISEVYFEDGCWMVHESKTCDVDLYLYDNINPTKVPLTEIYVIGNVFENPELLKED